MHPIKNENLTIVRSSIEFFNQSRDMFIALKV